MMTQSSLEIARFNMIHQQIRPAEVLDPRVLEAMEQTPRDAFVSAEYKLLAYSDTNIPVGNGQSMLKPIMEGRILQALNTQPGDRALEIGTGSGYFTALLCKLGAQVTSIELDQTLLDQAKAHLDTQGIAANLQHGDGSNGWPNMAPYDVIAVTGSMPLYNEALQQQLSIGGRLCVIVGTAPSMSMQLITRISETQWSTESLFETVVPALENCAQPAKFVF